jgi:hypothetical protein
MAKRVVLNNSRRSRDSTRGHRRLTPFCRFVIGKPSHEEYRIEWGGGGFELEQVEHSTHFDQCLLLEFHAATVTSDAGQLG